MTETGEIDTRKLSHKMKQSQEQRQILIQAEKGATPKKDQEDTKRAAKSNKNGKKKETVRYSTMES